MLKATGLAFLKAVLAVMSGLITWYATYRLFMLPSMHVQDPLFCSIALVATVAVHEIGHAMMFNHHGVKTWIVFLFIMGGTIPETSSAKFKNLAWSSTAAIALAGMVGNLLAVLGYLFLYLNNTIDYVHFSWVLNINGTLMLWNLLPLGMFDGGHFAESLFNSVPGYREKNFVMGIGATVGIVAVIATLLGSRSFLLQAWLLFWGLQQSAKKYEPNGDLHDKRAMTAHQQMMWAEIYVVLLCISIVLAAISRPWTGGH